MSVETWTDDSATIRAGLLNRRQRWTRMLPAMIIGLIAIMGLSAAKAFVRPVWNQCRFYGWNALQFEEVFENVFDKMATKDNQRFWRT